MGKMMLVLLGLLLTVIMAGQADAAWAAEDYLVSGGSLPQKIEGLGGTTTLKGTLLKSELDIQCKKSKSKGEIEGEGASKGEITLTECSAGTSKETFANCEVPNTTLHAFGQLVTNSKGEVEIEYAPEAKSFTVEVKNKGEKSCTEKGLLPVEGAQVCGLPSSGTLAKEHETKCAASGSLLGELKFNGEPATFESTETSKLNSGLEWQIGAGPAVTVSHRKATITGAALNVAQSGTFRFTNNGAARWTPTVARNARDEMPLNGSRMAVPTNTCTAGVAGSGGTCEVKLEIEPTAAGTYVLLFGLTNGPFIEFEVKT